MYLCYQYRIEVFKIPILENLKILNRKVVPPILRGKMSVGKMEQ